jgi:hypothetical protein
MDDATRARLQEYEQRTGKEIDYEAAEKFYDEFDLEGVTQDIADSWAIEILDPEASKEYQEDILTYSYTLTNDTLRTKIFQPHDPAGEGFTVFENEKQAQESAEAQVQMIATTGAMQRRDSEFLRTIE